MIGRLFEIILYNEDGPIYFDQLLNLENFCIENGFYYYYITHDKDVYLQEDLDSFLKEHDNQKPNWKLGDLKKTHTHYLIYTGSGTTTTAENIANVINIKSNKVQKKTYVSSSIKYLVHLSTFSQEKACYNWQDILTNDSARVNKIFDNLDENISISDLVRYIDESSNIIEYRQFVDYVLKKELWSFYRRSASVFKLLIDEHNNKIKANW